jgi:hypothetical protein
MEVRMRSHTDLDVYQVAYLCGGPERPAMVVLVALCEDRQIKISSVRHRVDTVRRAPRDPVEVAALDAIPRHGRVLGPAVQIIARSAAVEEIGRTLRAERLLPDSPISALWQWRRALTRRRIRHRLTHDDTLNGLRRVAVLGPRGITDHELRTIFQTPDPAPVQLPGKPPDFPHDPFYKNPPYRPGTLGGLSDIGQ